MNNIIGKLYIVVLIVSLSGICFGADEIKTGKSPLDELPPYIRQVTYFGERADWSADGKKILFLSKTFGDVFEVEVETDSTCSPQAGKITNYSNSPKIYDEPEGIFPDGKYTLVECDAHRPMGTQYIDIYKLALDGSGQMQRLTHFADYPGYKAGNPVVSDDGKFIAFQYAKLGDQAGVGRGILVFDINGFNAANSN